MANSAREFMDSAVRDIERAGGSVALSPRTRVLPGDRFGILRGMAVLQSDFKLYFLLVLDSSGPEVALRKYRFHLMSAENKTVFRYDNTRNHRRLKGFPHHKHIGLDETAVESGPPDLGAILEETREQVRPQR